MSNTPSQILTQSISNKKALGNAAFVPFITAGFPQINDTKDILFALEAGGADAIEVKIKKGKKKEEEITQVILVCVFLTSS